MNKNEILLRVENFSVIFSNNEKKEVVQKEVFTIKNANLEIRNKEIVAIIGASGSGKSLLAHGIMGILPHNALTTGKIYYYGEEITKEKIEKLRGNEFNLVPQGVSFLNPLMKVGNQILKGNKELTAKEKCLNMLKMYRLDEGVYKMYPMELSGGMARRVLISTASINEPQLVIADEPTPGLHKSVAKQVMSHFRELADLGAGVLFITHDLELAIETADKIVVFNEGTTVETIEPSDFVNNFENLKDYTKMLYKSLPQNWDK